MSRGAGVTNAIRKGVTAFEIEIENFWVERICDLEPGHARAVFLTPNWLLTFRHKPGFVRVGGSHYDRRITLADFRDDCFEALQERA